MINPTGMSGELLLAQIRELSSQSAQIGGSNNNTAPTTSFADAIAAGIQDVNALQQSAAAKRDAYEAGENIPLTDVVIGMQKSSLSFEATLQIRNKVMKAYEDIMNMPV